MSVQRRGHGGVRNAARDRCRVRVVVVMMVVRLLLMVVVRVECIHVRQVRRGKRIVVRSVKDAALTLSRV